MDAKLTPSEYNMRTFPVVKLKLLGFLFLVRPCFEKDPSGLIYSVFCPLLAVVTWELPF